MVFENIRNLREDHDYTQAQLAELLQVHQTTYSSYELGKLGIPAEALIQLADFYQGSVVSLRGWPEIMPPQPSIMYQCGGGGMPPPPLL